jgi:hypothetical protein
MERNLVKPTTILKVDLWFSHIIIGAVFGHSTAESSLGLGWKK